MNVLVVSAPRSGSTYVAERLLDSHQLDYNLHEAFTVALRQFHIKAKPYNKFCNDWNSNKCIAKINIPHDWLPDEGKFWLKNNMKQADVYYLSRDRVEHILDLIAEYQERIPPVDWEDEPTNVVISDPAQIIEYHNHLNYVDTIFSEMKKINKGHDITLEEVKNSKEQRDYGKPKRVYNYINELPEYKHLDVKEAVSLIINNT